MAGAKRVLTYSEDWASRSGGEKYLLCCIETLLRSGYHVTIVAQADSFDKNALERYFRVNIDDATLQLVDGDVKALRTEAEAMSNAFDICIYMTNYRFFNSRARQTVVILQLPYGSITAFTLVRKALRDSMKEAAKDYLRLQMVKRSHDTQAVLVYSRFVHDALDFNHDVPSTILEPAIDDFFVEGIQKERIILSVGRICRGLHNDKRYDVLIDAFKQLYQRLPNTTWQYRIVGSCSDDEVSRRYLDELRESAKGFPIYIQINASYEDVKRSYNEATLFWHATGFGMDEAREPERMEHFGMSTVEAMSAECVPIVIDRGGQKEIVSHGESGYLWNTVDELVQLTAQVIQNPAMIARVRQNARARFTGFDRQHFSDRLLSLMHRLA